MQSAEHPEINLLKIEEQDFLLLLIRRLPADRQQLIILKFVDRKTNAEIGQIMGRTEGAIKSLYHRTLQNLREEVKYLLEFYNTGTSNSSIGEWVQAEVGSDMEV